MAGHSKWANIKHRKGRADALRGKVFSRCSKEIISAIKLGGTDPKTNNRLRLALNKARSCNVPNDNIERVIKKASSADQADYVEMTYELYGHGGVGIIADVMTDNKNRIATEVRIATNKRGGTIATPGAVAFNFERKGTLNIKKSKGDEETLFLAATEAGAEDFDSSEPDVYVVTTDPVNLYAVKEALAAQGYESESVALELLPKTTMECDLELAKANMALIEWLEDLEDIDAVYHNMVIPDELLSG